jgi:hypothetical protein
LALKGWLRGPRAGSTFHRVPREDVATLAIAIPGSKYKPL